jgi:hypothetical protein
MKRLLLIAVACLFPICGFSQGTVVFSNNGGAGVTNQFTGNLQPTGGTLLVALYGGTNLATLVQLGAAVPIAPIAGVFSGGNRTNDAVAPGGTGLFQVRAWDSTYGATYEAFLANLAKPADAAFGISATFSSSTGGAGAPPSTPVGLAATFPGMVVVPEPTTYALGALGLGLVWLARRRRE